jgi:hypothetical protein
MPAFRSEDVEKMRSTCKLPTATGTLASDCDPAVSKTETWRKGQILENIRFVEDREALENLASSDPNTKIRAERDKLMVWDFPDTETRVSERYLVVFDPQKGLSESADWGVITVIDRYWMMYGGNPEIVAQWRGRIDKDIAIWVGAQIATWYGRALFVVENNTYDSETKEDDAEFIFDTIADYYPNLYSRTPADKIKEGIPAKYGFSTNRSTKPMLINNYTAVLREQGYVERSEEALNEARTYERKKNGVFGAIKGKHDDIVMTRMIGLHVCYNEMGLPRMMEEGRGYRSEPVRGEADI